MSNSESDMMSKAEVDLILTDLRLIYKKICGFYAKKIDGCVKYVSLCFYSADL